MIRIIRKQELDLHALPWAELPVTDLGHVVKEITIHRKAVQAIKEWRHEQNMRTQKIQARLKAERMAVV